MTKRVLITGITGQDGSYLTDYLFNKGYEIHGIIRRSSTFNTDRIDHMFKYLEQENPRFFLHYGNLTDFASMITLIRDTDPDEIYHLGAQSHVKVSFELPIHTGSVTGLGTAAILEAVRKTETDCKFYQASSSEMFGASPPPQNEKSKFHPRNPYAIAKLYAFWMTVNYRESYGLHASNGILFNHESPRRGGTFVTKKIVSGIADILNNKKEKLFLGNLDAKRDWGYAPEFIEGMVKIMNYREPEDFVLGTGQSFTVKQFLQTACDYVGLDLEKSINIDPRYFRPAEVDHLEADPSKAERILKWKAKINCMDLVKIMMDYELEKRNLKAPGEGKELLEKANINWIKEHYRV